MAVETFFQERGRYGGLVRDRKPDDPELLDARHRMEQEAVVKKIAKVLESAPQMTLETRSRVIALLA